MSSSRDPIENLTDIIENADRIVDYLKGVDRAAFAGSGLVRDAVERCLERICEAAKRLGDHANTLMPDQPWGDISGMGNRLRHEYDRVNPEIIWNAVCGDIPGLVADARKALKKLTGDRP
jgi:uncharacterized protein with HEPN domain